MKDENKLKKVGPLDSSGEANAEAGLPAYTTKSWFKAALLGLLLGLAIIIPGVSGATIAIIFGLYEGLLLAIGNIFKTFKDSVKFLLPIFLGAIIGFLLGFLLVQRLFLVIPFILICLFAGLMTGAMPAVFNNARGKVWGIKEVCLFTSGLIIPIIISIVAIFITPSGQDAVTINATRLILYFVYGVVISLTQIVPGLSATAFLMMVGEFGAMLASLHFNFLISNPLVIVMFVVLALGFVLGMILFSKAIKAIIEKNKFISFVFISGLSVGSVISMFLAKEIVEVYSSWGGGVPAWQILTGVALFILGIFGSALLTRKELNKEI